MNDSDCLNAIRAAIRDNRGVQRPLDNQALVAEVGRLDLYSKLSLNAEMLSRNSEICVLRTVACHLQQCINEGAFGHHQADGPCSYCDVVRIVSLMHHVEARLCAQDAKEEAAQLGVAPP